jgi:hypothetical protein
MRVHVPRVDRNIAELALRSDRAFRASGAVAARSIYQS